MHTSERDTMESSKQVFLWVKTSNSYEPYVIRKKWGVKLVQLFVEIMYGNKFFNKQDVIYDIKICRFYLLRF